MEEERFEEEEEEEEEDDEEPPYHIAEYEWLTRQRNLATDPQIIFFRSKREIPCTPALTIEAMKKFIGFCRWRDKIAEEERRKRELKNLELLERTRRYMAKVKKARIKASNKARIKFVEKFLKEQEETRNEELKIKLAQEMREEMARHLQENAIRTRLHQLIGRDPEDWLIEKLGPLVLSGYYDCQKQCKCPHCRSKF